MKYLKRFDTYTEYQEYLNGAKFIRPNVSLILDTNSIFFNEIRNVGDIAYWDGSAVKFCTLGKWKSSLGTPVGVVVIPEGFAPDGKTRIIGLKPVDESGNPSSSHVSIKWGSRTVDTTLTNYTTVPITDNAGSTSTGSNINGYLPSDMFTGSQSYVDSEAKYQGNTPMTPSPYLGDKPNPEYSKELSGNNALSDFNGLSNTEYLVGLGSDYVAASAAWNYSDGVSNLQWYLPAAGELGYLMLRFKKINASISAVGGVVVDSGYIWSSSELSSVYAYGLYTTTGHVNGYGKTNNNISVRPFVAV